MWPAAVRKLCDREVQSLELTSQFPSATSFNFKVQSTKFIN
jgi:hypothetical protein